jgi:hypothetical protein
LYNLHEIIITTTTSLVGDSWEQKVRFASASIFVVVDNLQGSDVRELVGARRGSKNGQVDLSKAHGDAQSVSFPSIQFSRSTN